MRDDSTADATREELVREIRRHARASLAKDWSELDRDGRLRAVCLAVRDRAVERMVATEREFRARGAKRVHYLSMEFLMGQTLGNTAVNLEIDRELHAALAELGADFDELVRAERDAALGNGGLGRLAACFLDSMATLGIAGYGHGINYEYGLFRQSIESGRQRERPDNWLATSSPWQIERAEEPFIVPVYGHVEHPRGLDGEYNPMWLGWRVIVGVPLDMPVVGYGGETVTALRLYSARASDEFDMRIFNEGDYLEAVREKMTTETISKVLYPSDAVASGRELRLVQEYFLVACSLRDILRQFLAKGGNVRELHQRVAIQLNDTHPALTVAELMRTLVDEHHVDWDEAWNVTRSTLSYTNHTLLPEALERWPVELIGKVLPRHLQIIFEVNRRFLESVAERFPGDAERCRRMSAIEEGPEKFVRMANLSVMGSHKVNGVSELHSRLVKDTLFRDFHEADPTLLTNKTNGITQRRWLRLCNPALSRTLTEAIGDGWVTDLDDLRRIDALADDAGFLDSVREAKRVNKERLTQEIYRVTRDVVDPSTIFDVQAKRIHEYKRQLLNVLGLILDYLEIVEDGRTLEAPRCAIFAGKAAPGYWAAKEIIRLIHSVARVVNGDPRVQGQLHVVFLPDYRVSLAEILVPATDLSEQISTAGTEASGTGNMKFALNGALTLGTYDGANIEISEEVGPENIFIFGLRIEDVARQRAHGSYSPRHLYEAEPAIQRVLDALRGGRFTDPSGEGFGWIFDSLVDGGDHYFHLADLLDYRAAHRRVAQTWQSADTWSRMALHNIARMGKFSSDRTIREYAEEIWGVRPTRAAPARGAPARSVELETV